MLDFFFRLSLLSFAVLKINDNLQVVCLWWSRAAAHRYEKHKVSVVKTNDKHFLFEPWQQIAYHRAYSETSSIHYIKNIELCESILLYKFTAIPHINIWCGCCCFTRNVKRNPVVRGQKCDKRFSRIVKKPNVVISWSTERINKVHFASIASI